MLTSRQVRLIEDSTITEKAFQAQVIRTFKEHGWLAYHTHDSRHSAAGFPDVCAVHPESDRLVFAELKRQAVVVAIKDGGRTYLKKRRVTLSQSQGLWLDALSETGAEVHLWMPSDHASVLEVALLRTDWESYPLYPSSRWKHRRRQLDQLGIKYDGQIANQPLSEIFAAMDDD